MRVIAALMICSGVLAAGDSEAKMAGSVAKMHAAMEKQRAAILRQSGGESPGFFSTPWLSAAEAASIPPDPQVQGECEAIPDSNLRKLIVDASAREGVNPMLIQAMVRRESAGRPCAVSAKGAQGLMQLMPDTQADLGVRDPFDPAQNIGAGARYIKQMLTRYSGDLSLALAAYNAGPQRVDAVKTVPAIAETQAYVSAILSALKSFEEPERQIR